MPDISNIQTTLNQLKSTCKSTLGSYGAAGGNSSFVNSIFSLVDQGQNAIDGNDTQRAQAITSMVQNLLSMLSGISNESGKANQEVNVNQESAEKLDSDAEKSASDTNSELEKIMQGVAENTVSINSAIEKINELGADSGKIAEVTKAQEELQKQLDIIEENKVIVNDGVSSTEAKKEALNRIKEASAVIDGLVASILSIQTEVEKTIEEQNKVVENSSQNVEALMEDSVKVVDDGAEKLQGYMQEGSAQVVTNTATSTEGVADETAGAALTTSGTGTSWIPGVGQLYGQRAIQVGLDLTQAGATRISGSAANISSLAASLGKMGSDLTQFSSYFNNVSALGNDFSSIVGDYSSKIEPMIATIGSWASYNDANETLHKAITDADSKLSGNNETPNFNNFAYNAGFNTQEKEESSSDKQNDIFKFERSSFGI